MADTLTTCSHSLAFEVGTTSDDADRLNQVPDAIGTGTTKFPIIAAVLLPGTGSAANRADRFWEKILTVLVGTPQTFVLGDGSMKNGRNQAVVFGRLRRLLVRVRTPDGSKRVAIQLTGTAAAFLNDAASPAQVTVSDLEYKAHDFAGKPVAATDTLVVTATGATVTVDVVLVGN